MKVQLQGRIRGCDGQSRARENDPRTQPTALFTILLDGLTGLHWLCQTRLMTDVSQEDVNHALEVLGLTLPVTSETLARTRRVLLYTWNPARYSNLTNNPKKYMQAYKKAEEMTKLVEAAYTLLSALLIPDEASSDQRPS
jgi:hypothetical protein